MNSAQINRQVRRLHLWFGVAIGVQIGLWLISGLFMTWFSIDHVRGDHLKAAAQMSQIDRHRLKAILTPSEILSSIDTINPESMTLKTLDGELVWLLESNERSVLVNSKTAEVLSPLPKAIVIKIAQARYAGKGQLAGATYYQNPPREYGRSTPVWKVDFAKPQAASFYIDASSADVKAVRTGLWRVFDFMWGLHIMDWKNRDNFNSWWIKLTATLAIIFFITGVCLSIFRFRSMLTRSKTHHQKT